LTTNHPAQDEGDRVVVVGPVLMDHYYMGTVKQLDQTAAVPVIDVPPGTPFLGLGGAANAMANLVHMAMPTAFVSVVGDDTAGRNFLNMELPELLTRYVATDKNYQTPCKHRVYAADSLVARFDIDARPKANVEDKVVDMFMKCVDDAKPLAILVSDYDKGICTERTLQVIFEYARAHKVPVVVDPTPKHMLHYRGAHIITPNEHEVLAAVADPRIADVRSAAMAVCKELHAVHCIVTRGAAGMLIVRPNETPSEMPAVPALAVDSCGAGDTVAAAFTYGVAADMSLMPMLHFAATAAAIQVERPGASAVSLHQIHRRLTIVSGNQLKKIELPFAMLLRASMMVSGGDFGVANGVFDLMHPGHVSMLEQARKECDFLLVMLNSDESAARIKSKPINDYATRAASLAALPCVDAIIKFDEDTPKSLIHNLVPTVLFKGPEHAGKTDRIPEALTMEEVGGRIMTTTLEFDTHATDIRAKACAADEQEEADPQTAAPVSNS